MNKYYEGYVDHTLTVLGSEAIFERVGPGLRELVKQCQWREENCLNESFWQLKMTRNVLCWEFSPPQRVLEHTDHALQIVFGLTVSFSALLR